MPRTADHDARRTQICQGVRSSAVEHGLGSVTMAGAARAAGVSVGLVQHYYESKDALLTDTLRLVLSDILLRVDRATASAERRHARIETMLGAGLEQLLPLDKVRREEAYLRHAFAGLALDRPGLRPCQVEFAQLLTDRVGTAVRNAFDCGEVPDPDAVDPGMEAYSLLATVDGMSARLLLHPTAGERQRARAVIASRMSALFPGRCLRHPGGRSRG